MNLADRADHITTTIDQALDDWSTSGDAMRWAPPEANFDCPPIPGGRTAAERYAATHGVDGFTATAAAPSTLGRRSFDFHLIGVSAASAVAFEVARAMAAHRRTIQDAMEQVVVPAMRSLAIALEPLLPPPDLSARDRALELRRNRNTGPTPRRGLDGVPRRRR